MQRRSSARSSKGVGHRKSISSTKSVHLDHILPELAERDAQAAAMQAFMRAKDRGATELSLWPPSRYDNRLETSSHGSPQRCADNQSALRHQQSVRFIRPRASTVSRANTTTSDIIHTGRTGSDSPRVTEVAVDLRPEPNPFASGMASAAKGTAGDYINALVTSEEYYTPEDDIASAPSSYRRIRKSRSMITRPEYNTMGGLRKGYPTVAANHDWPRATRIMEPNSDENKPPAGLKAPKSMSFLKNRRDQCADSTSQEPPFLRSNPLLSDRSFKKSLRDVSNGATSIILRVPKSGSIRNKTRKASVNLKHKFKNLFNLRKDENTDTPFPPQQVQAYDVDDVFQVECLTDEGALSRVTSGVPSLHAVPSNQQLRSRQGSVETLGSERRVSDEKSRVTSWGNSDTNTVTTVNSLKGNWERQRLSIIKENGTHVTSSSARRAPAINHSVQPNNSVPSLRPQPPSIVDGQRIYSALMKRVTGMRRQSQNSEVQTKENVEDVRTTGVVPPRGSSYDCHNQHLHSPPTIRHVTGDDSDQESVKTTETVITPFKFRRSQTESMPQVHDDHEDVQEVKILSSLPTTPSAHETHNVAPTDRQTLAVPSTRRKPLPAQSLSTSKSLFFGSPTCHLFRTKSPYRRVLQGSMRTATDQPQPKSPEFNPWTHSLNNLPLRCPSTCESEVDPKMQYAKSIYSCITEEPRNTSNNTLAINQVRAKTPNNHREATVFVESSSHRLNPLVPLARPMSPKERVTSVTSPVEWKAWLSANTSNPEGSPVESECNAVHYSLPSMSSSSRHLRENAQIIHEEDDEREELDVYRPTRPDTILPSTEHNSKLPTYLPRLMLRAKAEGSSPDKENEAPYSPPIPPRNILRTMPSSSTITKIDTQKRETLENSSKDTPLNSTPRKSLAHMRSLNAIGGNSPRGSPSSTSKLPRRQARPIGYSAPMSSPGIAAAVDKQFGALDNLATTKQNVATTMAIKSENVSPRVGADKVSRGDERVSPETRLGPQGSGSKRMVDLFLNSRRRRIASSEDGSVFL